MWCESILTANNMGINRLDAVMKPLKALAGHLKEKVKENDGFGQLSDILVQLDAHVRTVNALPREEAVGRRVSVVKLQKDHERVKTQYQTILSNYSTVRVDRSAGATRDTDGSFSAAFDTDLGSTDSPRGRQQQQQQALMLHGQDVDDAIIEEREQDIKKINQDLVLVNEMFRWVRVSVYGESGCANRMVSCVSWFGHVCMYVCVQGHGSDRGGAGQDHREDRRGHRGLPRKGRAGPGRGEAGGRLPTHLYHLLGPPALVPPDNSVSRKKD